MVYRAGQLAVAAAAVDSDSATASESDAMLRRRPDSQATTWWAQRRAASMATASLLLAAAACVALTRSGQSDGARPASDVLALSAAQGAVQHRKGCSNWDAIRLMPVRTFNASNYTDVVLQCRKLCELTPGCNIFNTQPGECGTDEQISPGACWIYGKGCEVESNNCWDLHQVDTPTPGWSVKSHRTGCANWEEILVGMNTSIRTKSAEQCGSICSRTTNCTGFNFQPGPCAGPDMIGEGACYLYNGTCNETLNACWDVYDYTAMAEATTTTTFKTKANATEASRTLIETWASLLGVPSTELSLSSHARSGPDAQGLMTYSRQVTWMRGRGAARRLAEQGRRLQETSFAEVVAIMKSAAEDPASLAKNLSAGLAPNGATDVSTTAPSSTVVDVPPTTTPATTTTR